MAKTLLPLCSLGRITTRDGYTGPFARAYLLPLAAGTPGYWFANGGQITSDNTAGNIPQDQSYTMQAPVKPNVFVKDCCSGCDDVA